MDFEQSKKIQLSKRDRSDKGNWDKAITPLTCKINSNKDYYTTSSCAGRIVLIKDNEKKREGLFLFRTHESITSVQIKKELMKCIKNYKKLIYLKQEPCILHIACSSIEKAQQFLDKAKLAGWKKSGIMASRKRVICEMESTERVILPIANRGKLLFNENYLKIVVKEANKKLMRTREKIKKLRKSLQ
jgi:tRNA wybutosine-synthesizing protein 3